MLWLKQANGKQPITQIKRPHYPIWVIYPQLGNHGQCPMAIGYWVMNYWIWSHFR